MNDVSPPKKPLWKSKAVIFAIIFSCLFLTFFYMAVTNEPDYMPSQQNKPTASIDKHLHENMQMSNEPMKSTQAAESHSSHQ